MVISLGSRLDGYIYLTIVLERIDESPNPTQPNDLNLTAIKTVKVGRSKQEVLEIDCIDYY